MVTIAVVGFHGSTEVPLRPKATMKDVWSAMPATSSAAADRPPKRTGKRAAGSSASSPKPAREAGEEDERRRSDDAGGVRLVRCFAIAHNRLSALSVKVSPMQKLMEGLWRWTARHPEWHPGEFGAEVACFAAQAGDTTLLIDPLLPPEPDRKCSP